MSTEPTDESAQSDIAHNEARMGDPMLAASLHPEPSHADASALDPSPSDPEPSDTSVADGLADAMKDQLRKDVASWREGRADGSSRQATELSVAVTRSIVPPTNARMKRAKPVTADPKPVATEKKPFGMSYDGTSRADYIKLMISRGAR